MASPDRVARGGLVGARVTVPARRCAGGCDRLPARHGDDRGCGGIPSRFASSDRRGGAGADRLTAAGPTRASDGDGLAGDGVEVIRAVTGGQPMGIAVDATDTWGRVFVADRSSDRLSVIFGRSPGLTIDCQLKVGTHPYAVAVDADTGHVLVTLRGEPRVAVVDGRADDASVLGWVELEANPAWIAIDQETRRAFVSMPEEGRSRSSSRPTLRRSTKWSGRSSPADTRAGSRSTRRPVGSLSRTMASPNRRMATSATARSACSMGAPSPRVRIGEAIAASVPSGIAFDPVSGNAYVLENGTDELMTIVFPETGAPTVSRSQADPYVDEGQNVNPVDLVFLPATRELIATQASRSTSPVGGHLSVLRVDDLGRPTLDRTIPASDHTTGDRPRPAERPRLRLVPRRGHRRRARRGRRADRRRSARPDRHIDAQSARSVVRAGGHRPHRGHLVVRPAARGGPDARLQRDARVEPRPDPGWAATARAWQGVVRQAPATRGPAQALLRQPARPPRLCPRGLAHLLVPDPGFPVGQRPRGVRRRGARARGRDRCRHRPGPAIRHGQVLGARAHPRRLVDARARGRVRVHQPPVGDAAGVHVRDHRCLRVHGRAQRRGRGAHGGAGCRRPARGRGRRLVRPDPVRADARRSGLRPRPDDQSRAGRHLHRRGRGPRLRSHPAELPARPAHLGVESLALARPLGGRPRALRARPRLPGHGRPAEP